MLAYVAAERSEALLQDLEATQQQLVGIEEQEAPTDIASVLQLSFLRLQLAKTRLAHITMLGEKVQDRQRLAHSIGLPVRALFDVEVTYDFGQKADPRLTAGELRRQALRSRSDMLNAIYDYANDEAALRVELARSNPNIWFPTAYAWDSVNNRWAVNLRLELAGVNWKRGRIAKAEAGRVAAAARLLNLETEINDQVETGIANYGAALQQALDVGRLVTDLRQQHEALVSQRQAATASQREVLLIELQLEAAEVFNLDAQVKLHEALGALENAIQRPIALMDSLSIYPQAQSSGPPAPSVPKWRQSNENL